MPSTFQRHPTPGRVTVGVDTHADVHVAAAVDQVGRLLDSMAVPITIEGYAELLAWAEGLGGHCCIEPECAGEAQQSGGSPSWKDAKKGSNHSTVP